MNITELARRLKISTQELRDFLPKLGFDIGQKAIKIDENLAQTIIKNWRRLVFEYNKKEEYKRRKEELEKKVETGVEIKKDIKIPQVITVRELAVILTLPISTVISELMKNGIMASLNERIDYETASIITSDLGFNVLPNDETEIYNDFLQSDDKLKQILESQKKTGTARPPVVVIMGHVDHGKTKLLDTIRTTNVVATEAGGITQHIGAYQVERKNRFITFIDTPGHEAFTAMRSRGAKVADIAILVVSADDSVKTQTIEAIRIIQNAKIPLIVAINKIDKEEANIDRVKTDLSKYNLIPEDWGGKTIMVPISALKGIGIDELLDMILLTADLNKEDLIADPTIQPAGTIIESHINKGEGIIATILVQAGTLRAGDILSVNGNYYGKIKMMKDYIGKEVKEALPSVPVKIIGLKIQPKVGDLLEVPVSEKDVSKKVKKYDLEKNPVSGILFKKSEEDAEAGKKVFPIVLRADVLGSLEAIVDSLEKIESEYIKVKIISKGLGNVTENDVKMASSSNATLLCFHINNSPTIEMMAREHNVKIYQYKVIYKLIEEVKEMMEKLIGDEIVRKDFGKLEILAIFKTEKKSLILGGKVVNGILEFNPKKFETKVTVTRKGEYITDGILSELQEGKQQVNKVEKGKQCGIRFDGKPDIQVGDVLEMYSQEKVKRVL